MAASSIDTAVRNAVACGADPDYLALLDNFCWSSSNKSERLAELVSSAKACFDLATSYGTPFISGKDSMFNDFKGFDHMGKPATISVPPTLLISSLGVISDVSRVITLDAKFPGDLVYLLGETYGELGGSEYMHYINQIQGSNKLWGRVPKVNRQLNLKLYRAFYRASNSGLLSSAVSLGHGGIAVGLLKTAMAGNLGLNISLQKIKGSAGRNDIALFSESQGRIFVTVNPNNKKDFEKHFLGLPVSRLGTVTEEPIIKISGFNQKIQIPVAAALKSYKSTFKGF
jgi:phosphoribosylformylglycinamidine synthase